MSEFTDGQGNPIEIDNHPGRVQRPDYAPVERPRRPVWYVEFYEYEPERFSLTLARGGTLRNVGSADVKYIQCETEREAAATLLQEISDDPQHNYASPHQIRQAQAILEGDPAR